MDLRDEQPTSLRIKWATTLQTIPEEREVHLPLVDHHLQPHGEHEFENTLLFWAYYTGGYQPIVVQDLTTNQTAFG